MGDEIGETGYSMRGALASDLFMRVRSTLPSVAEFLIATKRFDEQAGPLAADIWVTAATGAPQRRFLPDEYYARIAWHRPTLAHVETNGATGTIDWSGHAGDVLKAELRIFPEGAPESVGMFLRLVASLLLPSRNRVLVHASAVVSQGEGHVFLGESGAGKTTTARRAGREGAMRIADDLAILFVGDDGIVAIEPWPFDRGGRLPLRVGKRWPVRAAYAVRKGALRTEAGEIVDSPLATWCAAILSSVGPPTALDSVLSFAFALSGSVPPRALYVRPEGAILPALSDPP